MKNLTGLIILILIIAGCSFLNKKTETNNDAPLTNTATKPDTTTGKSDSILTLEKFNQLQNGMK